MTMQSRLQKGEVCFIKLDQFQPEWRQAVIVQAVPRKDQLYLACRVLEAELLDKASNFSSFKVGGQQFLLVVGKKSQVRQTCSAEHRALEIPSSEIATGAMDILESGTLQCMTASEDLSDQPRRKEKEIFVDPNSSASSSEAESEEDDVMKLLLKAQKAGRGKGTTSDALLKPKKKDKVDRYPMLSQARSSKDVSGDGLEQAILQTIAGEGSDKKLPETSLQTLVTLELLKTIRGKSKARSSMSRTKDDSSDDSSDDSLEENSKLRGAGKAIRDYRQGHRKMKKDPIRHVKRYVQEVEESLGVQGTNVAYNLSDYSRRLQWGKQRTLFRIHVAVSELLQTQLKGHHELATLQSVQLLRAVHQSCLDGGSWRAAALLLQHPDPLDKPKFGGEPGQLEHIASYLKAIQDLERRSLAGADPGEDGGKKGKKGKKQKEDDHTDQ